MKIGETKYLGDGLYYEWDGYHLVLKANNPTTDIVYLDHHVRNALLKLLQEKPWEEDKDARPQ